MIGGSRTNRSSAVGALGYRRLAAQHTYVTITGYVFDLTVHRAQISATLQASYCVEAGLAPGLHTKSRSIAIAKNVFASHEEPPIMYRTSAQSPTAVALHRRTMFPALHRVNGVDLPESLRDRVGALVILRCKVNPPTADQIAPTMTSHRPKLMALRLS
jgi:hypothetical protein